MITRIVRLAGTVLILASSIASAESASQPTVADLKAEVGVLMTTEAVVAEIAIKAKASGKNSFQVEIEKGWLSAALRQTDSIEVLLETALGITEQPGGRVLLNLQPGSTLTEVLESAVGQVEVAQSQWLEKVNTLMDSSAKSFSEPDGLKEFVDLFLMRQALTLGADAVPSTQATVANAKADSGRFNSLADSYIYFAAKRVLPWFHLSAREGTDLYNAKAIQGIGSLALALTAAFVTGTAHESWLWAGFGASLAAIVPWVLFDALRLPVVVYRKLIFLSRNIDFGEFQERGNVPKTWKEKLMKHLLRRKIKGETGHNPIISAQDVLKLAVAALEDMKYAMIEHFAQVGEKAIHVLTLPKSTTDPLFKSLYAEISSSVTDFRQKGDHSRTVGFVDYPMFTAIVLTSPEANAFALSQLMRLQEKLGLIIRGGDGKMMQKIVSSGIVSARASKLLGGGDEASDQAIAISAGEVDKIVCDLFSGKIPEATSRPAQILKNSNLRRLAQ